MNSDWITFGDLLRSPLSLVSLRAEMIPLQSKPPSGTNLQAKHNLTVTKLFSVCQDDHPRKLRFGSTSSFRQACLSPRLFDVQADFNNTNFSEGFVEPNSYATNSGTIPRVRPIFGRNSWSTAQQMYEPTA